MGRIAQETINRVLDEVDILEVISQICRSQKKREELFWFKSF